jgi:hypothetical protein
VKTQELFDSHMIADKLQNLNNDNLNPSEEIMSRLDPDAVSAPSTTNQINQREVVPLQHQICMNSENSFQQKLQQNTYYENLTKVSCMLSQLISL